MKPAQADISSLSIALAEEQRITATALAETSHKQAQHSGPVFISVTGDMSSATESDFRLQSGAPRSILEGIPIAVKDVIDTAGIRTTMGSKLFANNLPTKDAPIVSQLKSAGTNIIGKTNTHEFSYGIRGDVGAFGVVTNPNDPERVAGGSSSGSATAVAHGIVPLAVGTDTAGSVRVPAALCGVVGFKPTLGLFDTTGIFPLAPSFDTVGFLATTVTDIVATIDALGFSGFSTQEEPDANFRTLTDNPILGTSDFSEPTTHKLLKTLNAKPTRHPKSPRQQTNPMRLYNVVRAREAFLAHEKYIALCPKEYQPSTLAKLREGALISSTQVLEAQKQILEEKDRYLEAFAEGDVLISSTVPIDAPRFAAPSAEDTIALMSQCVIWNLIGWPALSIPYWISGDPLPKAIQLIGKPGQDAALLRAGIFLQREFALHNLIPH